jgi:hypothetical protein
MKIPNEFVVVGDLHGRLSTLKKIIALGKYMIFLGDFLDSWTESVKNQIAVVRRVIELHKENKARFILGNHELSYIEPKYWRCSGFNYNKRIKCLQYLDELWERGEVGIIVDSNILITHAGITNPLWKQQLQSKSANIEEGLPILLEMMQAHKNYHYSWLYAGDRFDVISGPYWVRWHTEFQPVPGLIQIVGHTPNTDKPKYFDQTFHDGLRRSDNGDWCIDCLDLDTAKTVLHYDNGELKPLVLE